MSRFRVAVPALPVADVATSATFYRDTLGFHVAHEEPRLAILTRDQVELHLWGATDASWKSRKAGAAPVESGAETFLAGTGSCRIEVDDLGSIHAACVRAGVVHPNGPLGEKPWGAVEFAILDPDGNCITFTAPLRPDPDPL